MKIPQNIKSLLKQDRQKYGNHKAHCLSKHLHDSKLEANHCNSLLADLQRGKVLSYEVQVPFDLVVNGKLICRHILDFYVCVTGKEHIWEVRDAKGVKTRDWIIKRKLFEALYPSIPYVVVTREK